MASHDFMNLMTKLHQERYNVLSINMSSKKVHDCSTTVASVVLVKGEEKITLQSTDWDFIKYLVELRGIVDLNGEYRFKRLKDTNQYDADVKHLIDIDHSKIKKAIEEIKSGKFTRKYSPPELIDEFLKNKENVKDVKFLPLKRDYYYILAAALIESNKMLDSREAIIKKCPETQKLVKAVEGIFLKSFRPTGNALKDYKFYKKYVNFDIDDLGERMSTQLKDADDTMKEFIKRREVDTNISFPRMINIYANFLEILSPMLNLMRIGLELRRDNKSPNKHCELVENIGILKSDTEFGQLFGCLDEQIRHASAHASFRIHKAVRQVYLMDERGSKGKIVRTYTFDKLTNMLNTMQNEFFPVIYPTIVIFDIAILDLLLASREYKHLLLAVGNCKKTIDTLHVNVYN